MSEICKLNMEGDKKKGLRAARCWQEMFRSQLVQEVGARFAKCLLQKVRHFKERMVYPQVPGLLCRIFFSRRVLSWISSVML